MNNAAASILTPSANKQNFTHYNKSFCSYLLDITYKQNHNKECSRIRSARKPPHGNETIVFASDHISNTREKNYFPTKKKTPILIKHPTIYLRKPLLSSCSARTLTDAINRSSYPRNSLKMNRLSESPKQVSFCGSNSTVCTGMFNFCLVADDSRRKPYSSEYSTIYCSSCHPTQKSGI